MPPPIYMWISVEVSDVAFKHVGRQLSGRYRTQPALLSIPLIVIVEVVAQGVPRKRA